MRHDTIDNMVAEAIPQGSYADQWDAEKLGSSARNVLGVEVPAADWIAEDGIAETEITERLQQLSDRYMAEKAVRFGAQTMRMAEKSLLLQVLDQQWKEHLLQLEQLRQGISLRAYAQKDPLNEYKREAFMMFDSMLNSMRQTVTMALSHVEVRSPDAPQEEPSAAQPSQRPTSHIDRKISRNAPCPCGSGKKYKYCHGKL
jgi:preprotein translocase subunit SecA